MNPKIDSFHFRIDHVDPLGQGVHKEDGKITFIPKTLPGETGKARILKSRKGVRFAKMQTLARSSQHRVQPECPHFEQCPGCDYLHTDYEIELLFKQNALKKYFQKIIFDWEKLQVLPAPHRTGYRNRIQLHYRKNQIGLIDSQTGGLVEIPECAVIQDHLRPALNRLYADRFWPKGHPPEGHCELYAQQGRVQITWNQAYAKGGFTQVNDTMNAQLRRAVSDVTPAMKSSTLLDLFSGNGNLSDMIHKTRTIKRVMVDNSPQDKRPDFIRLDLFSPSALRTFEKQSPLNFFDLILLDPPRKGFPFLNDWVTRYRPEHLIYVSCHPGTLARDMESLQQPYEISDLMLIDLFPGTRHFETLASIRL